MKELRPISRIIYGRLIVENDINSEIITDLSIKEGDRLVIRMIHDNGTETLQVINNMPYCENKGEIKTFQKFYTRFDASDTWNSLDSTLIDTNVYPNGEAMITKQTDEVNLGTEEEPILTNKYDMFRYSAFGRGIEMEVFNSSIQRLIEAGLYIIPD